MRAGGVDDAPPALFLHPGHSQPCGVEYGGEVECDNLLPTINREFIDWGNVLHPGIVHQNIERACLRHHRFDFARFQQVRARMRRADVITDRRYFIRIAKTVDHNTGAFGSHCASDREPYA